MPNRTTDNPRTNIVTVRFSDAELKKLSKYVRKLKEYRSDATSKPILSKFIRDAVMKEIK